MPDSAGSFVGYHTGSDRHTRRTDFAEDEILRVMLINKAPKYGNDIDYVDALGTKWVNFFADELKKYHNGRFKL